MSKYIASSAIRGAHELIHRVDKRLQEAIAEYGPEAKVEFTNTAYYLPIILGMTGIEVKTLGDMASALEYCRDLLQPVPSSGLWTPYLGTTLDAGIATLMAEEILMGIGFVDGTQPEPFDWEGSYASPAADNDKCLNGPIDDIQLRAWGIQLVDGRMPGFAAVIGCAKSNEVAVQIVRELQRRNILVFLSGNVNGRSIVQQLMEEGVELGYDTYTVPFGTNTESTSYALGFATRSALTFGGLKGGQAKEILEYNEHRTFAFALALGPVDDLKYATAAGAINYGFPAMPTHASPTFSLLASPFTKPWFPCLSTRSKAGMTLSGLTGWSRGALRCAASKSKSPRCLYQCPMARPSRASGCAGTTCALSSVARNRGLLSTCACCLWMKWRITK